MRRLLLLFSIFFIVHTVEAKYVIGYYYANYANCPYNAIDYSNLTHICHAFITPNNDGSLAWDYWFPYPDLIKEAHKHGIKILVSIGGYGATGFTAMVSNTTARNKFIDNLVSFCLSNGYDGADLDWEYPGNADRENLKILLTDLRAAFTKNNIPLLAAALPSTDWNAGYDIATLAAKLDWIGIMTYDFTGPWETKVYHNSCLFESAQQHYSIDQSVAFYNLRGMPKEKICIGMPFYGYLLNATGMFQTINTVNGSKGKSVTYNTIVNTYLNSPDWTYNFDSQTKNPYLVNTSKTQVITYDDTASTRMKCEYVNSRSLAGAIIWEIKQSYNGSTNPLLEVAGQYLLKSTTSVAKETSVPESFSLSNYPNPFNPVTKIRYSIPGQKGTETYQRVRIDVTDMLGRSIKTLLDEEKSAGSYEISFDAANLSSGIYFCRIASGSMMEVRKMILSK